MRNTDGLVGLEVICVDSKDDPWGKLTKKRHYVIKEIRMDESYAYESFLVEDDNGRDYWYSAGRFEPAEIANGFDTF